MSDGVPSGQGVPVFEAGDLVRVRNEEVVSAVVLPTGRRCSVPDDAPSLGDLCCVPVALIVTPAGGPPEGQRWVEIADLSREPSAEDLDAVDDLDAGSLVWDGCGEVQW